MGPRDPDEALALFDGVHGAIVASEPITAEMLDHAPELKVLARSGIGYDSIDVAATAARRIQVCNTPGANHDAVAELTIALMLMTARRLTTVVDDLRAGRWPPAGGLFAGGLNRDCLAARCPARVVVRARRRDGAAYRCCWFQPSKRSISSPGGIAVGVVAAVEPNHTQLQAFDRRMRENHHQRGDQRRQEVWQRVQGGRRVDAQEQIADDPATDARSVGPRDW